jgi:hypothetical protein
VRVRQSQLKVFGDCANQYRYSYVLGLGGDASGSLTVLGSVWHYAVDVYETYDHDINLAKRTFIYYWSNPNELGLKIDFWHRSTTFMGLQKRGLDMLDRYHELSPWKTGIRVGSEVRFVVPIGDHELEGTIDKIWVRKGQKKLSVVDFKTGAMVPEALRYNQQFSAYCYATTQPEFWVNVPGFEDGHKRFAHYKRDGWWYHARNNKMFNAGFREQVDYDRLQWAIIQMDLAVKNDVFPLTVTGATCGYCSHVEICGTEVSLALQANDASA